LEASLQNNFNFGFSTYKSDILIHLSQWQYWWWFWFSLVWVAYYYIILYCITRRTFTFNPVLNTSIRGHGKWGDFLVALIPLSWCGNILINSNFILRMIEWQNESSLFTLRVQGKQWYWVYKFDSTSVSSIFASPKNLGNNKWLVWSANDVEVSDSYYQALTLAAQLEFNDTYKVLLNKVENLSTPLNSESLQSKKISVDTNSYNEVLTKNISYFSDNNDSLSDRVRPLFENNIFIKKIRTSVKKFNFFKYNEFYSIDETQNYLSLKDSTDLISYHYDYFKLDDTSNTMGNIRLQTSTQPIRFVNLPLNLFILENKTSLDNFLFNIKYSNSNDQPTLKTAQLETFWGFRQKKYKRLKKFLFLPKLSYDHQTYLPVALTQTNPLLNRRVFLDNQIKGISESNFSLSNYQDNIKIFFKNINTQSSTRLSNHSLTDYTTKNYRGEDSGTAFDYYKAVRFGKLRNDLLSVTLARRLLRVKRTLVLPAHTNITIITNSYDVVHSWFIPGLGIKLDCVPGRSTHHTFYIDNIGFYYGQCAEICGRYHHHMPIRICALSFDQFLVWWQKKALPRLNRLNVQKPLIKENQRYLDGFISINTTKQGTLKETTYKYNW